MTPHPFPPVFRWVLFPALAAGAGAAAAVASAFFGEGSPRGREALVFAGLGAASAAGAGASDRPAVFIPLAVVLSWLGVTLAVGWDLGYPGLTGTRGEALFALVLLASAQSGAHALALRKVDAPTSHVMAVYGFAGACVAMLEPFLRGPSLRPMALHVLSTLAQGGAFLLVRAFARSPSPAHPPFPPVVRWMLFPALAGLAGGAGAAAPVAFTRPDALLWVFAGGTLCAAGAMGGAISSRVWIPVAASPLFAVAGAVVAYSLSLTWSGWPVTPRSAFRDLLDGEVAILLFAFTVGLGTLAHAAAIRLDALCSWRRGLAIYGGAAAILAALCAGFGERATRDFAPSLGLALLAQISPARVAAHLARRLI